MISGEFVRCRAEAIDAGTDRHIQCQLAEGHRDTHFWKIEIGNQLWSASWYGPDDGLPTFIGTRYDDRAEQM